MGDTLGLLLLGIRLGAAESILLQSDWGEWYLIRISMEDVDIDAAPITHHLPNVHVGSSIG